MEKIVNDNPMLDTDKVDVQVGIAMETSTHKNTDFNKVVDSY